MIRISVSDLECYRRYRDNDEVTLEECLAQINRELPPSPSMLAGRALHKYLEHAQPEDEALIAEQDGYRFVFQCEIELSIPDVRELKGELQMLTPSGLVTLVGIVDGLDVAVSDYKLTSRFDAERYADSYQWRCYLHMFNRSRFLYRIFLGDETAANEWVIREYHELGMWRYPNLERDVQEEVAECAAFFQQYVLKRAA